LISAVASMAWVAWWRRHWAPIPIAAIVFVFRSKRKDRLKVVVWDGSGMVLVTKWLEDGAFTFPPVQDGAVCSDSDAAIGFGGRIGLDPGCS